MTDGWKVIRGAATPEDIARVAAQIASIVDTSGVFDAVGACTCPKRSKYDDLLAP